MGDVPTTGTQWFTASEGPDSLHQYQLYEEYKEQPGIFQDFFKQGGSVDRAENYWKHYNPATNTVFDYGYLRNAPSLSGDQLPPSMRPAKTPSAGAVPPPGDTGPSLPGAPGPTFQLPTSNVPGGSGAGGSLGGLIGGAATSLLSAVAKPGSGAAASGIKGFGGGDQMDAHAFLSFLGGYGRSLLSGR